jgi:hypothetical protein
MTGVQLRTQIEERIRWHQGEVRRMTKRLKNPERHDSDTGRSVPEALLDAEIGRAERQIEVLTFIRDYIVPDEMYRLGEFDLRFADLLPDEEPWDCGCFEPGLTSANAPPKKSSEPH